MDSSSNQILDHLAIKKLLALYLVGSGENYQNYKRIQEIQQFYPNDFHYYNDTFYYRHQRNIEEIKKLSKLIKDKIIKPEMLIYNTWNTFYPSYILNHHFQVYTSILDLFKSNNEVSESYNKAKNLQEIGFYAENKINTDFGKSTEGYTPTLTEKGEIQMKQNIYFYDKHISLYYHVGCFLVKKQNDTIIVFVRIRDFKGDLIKQIGVKDFGQRISPQYLQIGYNFNKVKPFLAIKVNNQVKIKGISNSKFFDEFNLSLLDLKKSLYLAIKYTQMRQQFKTIPQSKLQRPIIAYQAVACRIINAFSKLTCFSQLNRALFNNKQIIPFASPLLDINHHLILESVIRLRQCCGGFGYLQVAGHGGCVQRLSLRASDAFISDIPQNVQILKRLHYYSSSDNMESYFGQMITKQNAFNPIQIFSVFINICVNMRKNSSQMLKQRYLREFMYQAAIQTLKTTQQFSRIPKDSLPFLVLFYESAKYILQNSVFVNWKYIESHLTKQQYFRGLNEFKNNYLNKLIQKIPLIQQILEINYLRNVIIGRQNKKQFYDEVLEVSKNNLRNSEQFKDYVKRPIVDFLVENNAKL